MAKRDVQTVFEFIDGAIRVGWGGRQVVLPASRQPGEDGDPVLVVEIDDADKQGEEEVAANNPDERRIADLLITAVAWGAWARQAMARGSLPLVR